MISYKSSTENKVPNPADSPSHQAGKARPLTVAAHKYVQFQGNTTKSFPCLYLATWSHRMELSKVGCTSAIGEAKTALDCMKLITSY